MTTQYIKFELSPGQMAPEGNTGIGLSDGYIVWEGQPGSFKKDAVFGRLTPQDPPPAKEVYHKVMVPSEIAEYEAIISGEPTASGIA